LAVFHYSPQLSLSYVTRKFRIIPMSSCSRIWQW
jgi:hypothetical protein